MRWVRRLVMAIVAGVLLSACRVDATVDVDVRDDGSGIVAVAVAFDDDAVARVPDFVSSLRLDDLTASGWTVTAPAKEADGRTVVRAEKPFESPERLPVVLNEVSGIFRDVRLERTRAFGRKEWELTGVVDMTGGAALFSDDQVATLLGGRPLGRDVTALEQETGAKLADSTSLALSVALPGEVAGNATTISGNTGRWTFRLDQPSPASIVLSGTTRRSAAIVWGGVALGGAGLLVLLLLIRTVRRGGRRKAKIAAAPPVEANVPAAAAPARRLELIIVDAHGVLWDLDGRDGDWLEAFVATRGGSASPEHVREVLAEATLGRLTSAGLWAALDVDGDPAELDAAYTAPFELSPEVADFVAIMARRGVGVACITNDVAEWSALLRRRFGLETSIRPWIVSGEAGVCKPDALIYEQAATRAGVPLTNCLFIDGHVDHLDAARRLGMVTVRLDPSADPTALQRDTRSPHRTVKGFADLLRPRPGEAAASKP